MLGNCVISRTDWMTATVSPNCRDRIRSVARLRRSVLAGVFALLIQSSPSALARTDDAVPQPRVGHAFSLETAELVYLEIHDPRTSDGRLSSDRVEYRGPDGELLALKTVDYTPDPICPAFRLEDRRTGYVEGLKWAGDGRPVVFTREAADAPVQRALLEVDDDLVADAGFDVMVYRQLQRLQEGATPVFPFAVPNRLRTVDFRLRSLGRREILGRPATVVRMEPANRLLRWLVDPIDVAYNAETGALLRYEGISNLPRPNGDGNYRVRIDFPPEGVDPVPPEPEDPGVTELP